MKKTKSNMSVFPLPDRIADELDRFYIDIRRRTGLLSLSFLLFTGAVCCGCGSTPVDGMNVRKTEFRISSVTKTWPGYVADTSGSQKNDVHDRISENWQRDLVLGRGSLLYPVVHFPVCTDSEKNH